MRESSVPETSTVKRAGAVSTPSMTKVSFSISCAARFASLLNEKGAVKPRRDPKMLEMRSSKTLKKFIGSPPGSREGAQRSKLPCP